MVIINIARSTREELYGQRTIQRSEGSLQKTAEKDIRPVPFIIMSSLMEGQLTDS